MRVAGRAIAPEEYRGILLNRQNDTPLDGLEELIVALHDIGEILQRPSLARLVRIAHAAEQVTEPPQPAAARRAAALEPPGPTCSCRRRPPGSPACLAPGTWHLAPGTWHLAEMVPAPRCRHHRGLPAQRRLTAQAGGADVLSAMPGV